MSIDTGDIAGVAGPRDPLRMAPSIVSSHRRGAAQTGKSVARDDEDVRGGDGSSSSVPNQRTFFDSCEVSYLSIAVICCNDF